MGTINTEHKMSMCIGRIELARTLVNIRKLDEIAGLRKQRWAPVRTFSCMLSNEFEFKIKMRQYIV